MRIFAAISLIGAVCLSGCAGDLRADSAGPTGCSPEEIKISAEHSGRAATTWIAKCKGDEFVCTKVAADSGAKGQANCMKKPH